MENAVEALKMAFAVLVFVIALTSVFSLISQAKSTVDVVFALHDRDVAFYDDLKDITNLSSSEGGDENRTVNWSTVVPTIYRYKEENYGVTIIDNGKIVARFSEKTEDIAHLYFGVDRNDDNEKHREYLNDNIIGTIPETTNEDKLDNLEDLKNLFSNLYNLKLANDDHPFGAMWLNTDEYMVARLDADVGNYKTKIYFANSGDIYHGDGNMHEGLGLGATYGGRTFKEYFTTVKPKNENDLETNDQEIFEIIYVAQPEE